jgi:hypothetical protein
MKEKGDSSLRWNRNSPVFGIFIDHLIDGSWYRENTNQRRNRLQFLAGNTPEERAELSYKTLVLLSKIK